MPHTPFPKTLMKFRKKPVVIEAVQLRWDTWPEICDFVAKPIHGVWVYDSEDREYGESPRDANTDRIGLLLHTEEGVMLAIQGDWIIKGVAGEFYPCKPEIFALTYEAV